MTARYLYICPTTQPLYQGAEEAGITRPEDQSASEATSHRLDWRVTGSNPERTFHFLRLQSRDNGCTMHRAHSEALSSRIDIIVAIGLYQFVNHCNMCVIFMIV